MALDNRLLQRTNGEVLFLRVYVLIRLNVKGMTRGVPAPVVIHEKHFYKDIN